MKKQVDYDCANGCNYSCISKSITIDLKLINITLKSFETMVSKK